MPLIERHTDPVKPVPELCLPHGRDAMTLRGFNRSLNRIDPNSEFASTARDLNNGNIVDTFAQLNLEK